MKLTNECKKYIQKMMLRTANSLLEAPCDSDHPNIIVYNPQPITRFICPRCSGSLKKTNNFTDGSNPAHPPRIIYHISRNVYLISVILSCQKCGIWLAHDCNIMQQAREERMFLLYHQSGVTKELFMIIINTMNEGKPALMTFLS
jgi:hypothetical protein